MRLRFIGENGSMALNFGRVYRLRVEPWREGVRITAPVVCPYDTEEGFWRNWCHPDVDVRTIMERRGRDLRELHLPKEPVVRECAIEDVHEPHEWPAVPSITCPGRTLQEVVSND